MTLLETVLIFWTIPILSIIPIFCMGVIMLVVNLKMRHELNKPNIEQPNSREIKE